jgi:anti-sigma B factor antagonist/stage II sporulation protein AA (anti-sigma F factor antagonist)
VALQSSGTSRNDSECGRGVQDPWECSAVEITHRAYADVVVVAPAGRLDHTVAEAFEQALMPLLDPAAGGGAGIVLDFSRVDYISSVGLRVLMIAGKAARARGARIAVAGLRPVVQEIFAISRFNGVVEIFPTVAVALAAISSAAATAYEAAAKATGP